MARGWESKSVESQIEDRQNSTPPGGNAHLDAARERELQVLELTRKRLEHEIAFATSKGFRAMKQRALSHIEEKIKTLQPH